MPSPAAKWDMSYIEKPGFLLLNTQGSGRYNQYLYFYLRFNVVMSSVGSNLGRLDIEVIALTTELP